MRVVSRWCRCVVQRLCATDFKPPCLVGRQPHTQPRHGCRACMPKGSMQGRIQVVKQSRCRTHRQQTTTIAQMQSQQSIHSPSPRGRGLGLGFEDKLHFSKIDFFYSLERYIFYRCAAFLLSKHYQTVMPMFVTYVNRENL